MSCPLRHSGNKFFFSSSCCGHFFVALLFIKLSPEATIAHSQCLETWSGEFTLKDTWVPCMHGYAGRIGHSWNLGSMERCWFICRDTEALLHLSKFSGSNKCSASPKIKAALFSTPSLLQTHILFAFLTKLHAG